MPVERIANQNVSPPKMTKRLRHRAMRRAKLTAEQYKLAEDRGWILYYSNWLMRGKVIAFKQGELYGPIASPEDINELLVDEHLRKAIK